MFILIAGYGYNEQILGGFNVVRVMTEEEIQAIKLKLEELMLEHRDLDDAIHHMPKTIHTQMQISRLKKRKLVLKDKITKLENLLIPDILA